MPGSAASAKSPGSAHRQLRDQIFQRAHRLRLHEPDPPWPQQVVQAATAFRSEQAAADFQKRQQKAWSRCAGKTATVTAVDGVSSTALIGTVGDAGDVTGGIADRIADRVG